MKNRFRFQGDLGLALQKSTSGAKGLVTEGIFDSNIDESEPGNIRIALWREWRAMLDDLRSVGPVWSIVRNGHCVLAVHGDYPKLAFASDEQSAIARNGDSSLNCHFRTWRHAVAFDTGCCCGRLYGVEIGNNLGQIFHRICLAKDTALNPLIEWAQMHQATGLEDDDDALPVDEGRFHPQSFRRLPGTLEVPLDRLRLALIHAAQREIPLIAGVASEGTIQTARIDISRTSETSGWLLFSGNKRSLYVESEPTGSLLLEPATLEGEPAWRLSLVDNHDHRLLHLQSSVDGRPAWNQLIREFVLCAVSE
jgi:hypothetical protein